ncbi:MAG: hypothetical protein WBG54_12375 [Acidobacteriaceae bacterium]
MAKTYAQIVREVLDRMSRESNEAKAREIARVLGKQIRQRARTRQSAEGRSTPILDDAATRTSGPRYSPIPIQGEPLSSTILRDRGIY